MSSTSLCSLLQKYLPVQAGMGLSLWARRDGARFPSKIILALVALATFFFTGCENPQQTADGLRRQIADFRVAPDEKKQLEIDQSFATLQTQIAKVEARDPTRAAGLQDQYVSLRAAYQEAKMAKTLNDAKNALQGLGEAVKDGAKNIGDVFKRPTTND